VGAIGSCRDLAAGAIGTYGELHFVVWKGRDYSGLVWNGRDKSHAKAGPSGQAQARSSNRGSGNRECGHSAEDRNRKV
jgi:hypothetical protein